MLQQDKLKTQFYKIDNTSKRSYIINKILCPHCGTTEVIKLSHKHIGECSTCNAVVNFLDPSKIQLEIARDVTTFVKLVVGGKGSGKTVINANSVANHMRKFPNANVGAKAQTENQLFTTGKRELEKFFLESEFAKKNEDYWTLNNGSRINWLTGDEESIRSMNFSFTWLIEASGIPKGTINEFFQRTRASVGTEYLTDEFGDIVYKKDDYGQMRPVISKSYNQVILETNPGIGYTRDLVMQSSKIHYTPTVKGIEFLRDHSKPKNDDMEGINSYLSSSVDNVHVDENWLRRAFAGMGPDLAAIHKFCDLSFSLGLIYPNYRNAIVEPFPIPKDWPWMMGLDPGYEAYDGLLWATFDYKRGIVYFFAESAERFADYRQTIMNIKRKEEMLKLNQNGCLFRMIDFAAGQKSKTDNKSGIDILYEQGRLDFIKSNKNIIEGINYFKTGLNTGRIKIFSNMSNMIKEFEGYHYQEAKDYQVIEAKPAPFQDDHLLDIARYIFMNMEFVDGRLVPLKKLSYQEKQQGDLELALSRINHSKLNLYNALDLHDDATNPNKYFDDVVPQEKPKIFRV